MKLAWKPIMIGGLLAGSMTANAYLVYLVVDQGISYSYMKDSFDSEHDRAEVLSALVNSKLSHTTPSDLRALAQKKGWDSFSKKTDSSTTELFVVNGIGFRIQKNRVIGEDVSE